MGTSRALGLEIMRTNPECKALLYGAAGRSMLFISILFLGTALLQYANVEAGERQLARAHSRPTPGFNASEAPSLRLFLALAEQVARGSRARR